MSKVSLCLALVLCLQPLLVLADTIDEAEAKRRGVPVQQVQLEAAQKRIAELEQQVADLQKQLQPKEPSGPAAPPNQPARPGLTDTTWEWHAGGDKPQTSVLKIKKDGSVVGTDGKTRGRWTFENGKLSIHWPPDANAKAWVDTVVMAEDGNSMSGKNQIGVDISARRVPSTTYDRFKDITTFATPDLVVNVTKRVFGLRELWLTASASFKGKPAPGSIPDLSLALSFLTDQAILNDGGSLILIVDGKRVSLDATAAGEIVLATLDVNQLKLLAQSKKVEGQFGLVEFDVTPDQLAEIRELFNAVNQEQ
jgi:hypothetical protein